MDSALHHLIHLLFFAAGAVAYHYGTKGRR